MHKPCDILYASSRVLIMGGQDIPHTVSSLDDTNIQPMTTEEKGQEKV